MNRQRGFLLIIAFLLFAASINSAQTKKSNPPRKTLSGSSAWQEIKWDKWGISFAVPPRFKQTAETPKSNPTRPDGYFGDTREYEGSRGKQPSAGKFELMLDVTNWKGEKVKTEYRGGEIELTIEQLLQLDHIGDKRSVEDPKSPALESDYLEIGGLKGVYVLANRVYDDGKSQNSNNDVMYIWQTYRHYQGNVQRVLVSVQGKRTDLETMKKIVASLKFSQ